MNGSAEKKTDPRAAFHLTNAKGEPTGVYDFKIFEYLSENYHILIIGKVPYLYSGGVFRPDLNGTKLKTEIRKLIFPHLIRSTTIDRIYKLFIDAEELQAKTEDLNHFPPEWIPFKNGFYDPVKKCMYPNSPSYKSINQLSIEYDPRDRPEGEKIEAWLRFAVPDPEDREMLLQFCGYCMTADTRQQRFMILTGAAGSGKSTVLRLLEIVIGADNISNLSLQDIADKFRAFLLVGKTLNICADMPTEALRDASAIKRLTGEDALTIEKKHGDSFSFRSSAKLLFSCNELPAILEEKTNGFFRRLLVLQMNNRPEEPRADFLETLLPEKAYFVRLCVQALGRMYEAGRITESKLSRLAVEKMRGDSDTVYGWIQEECEEDPAAKIERGFLYSRYESFCELADRRALTRNSFYKSLRLKGYQESTTQGARYFSGLRPVKSPQTSY